MPWKTVSVIVRYLFYQPIDEKIKTWPLSFPTKENPNVEKALFDWPIVLQYDVKAKYRLISRKFSGMKFFSPERSLNQPKATRVCIRSINQSNPSISVRLLFLFCSHIFISRSYEIALTLYKPSIYMQILQTDLHTFPWRIRGDSLFKNPRIFPQPFFDYVLILWWQNWWPTSIFS